MKTACTAAFFRKAARLTAPFILISILGASRPAAAEDMLDGQMSSLFIIDRLEYRRGEGADSINWNAQGWIGGDYNRLWLKTNGIKLGNDAVEEAEVQLLFSRLIAPFWDLQAGVRYDDKPHPSRSYAVLGVQGVAPYWLDIEAAAFASDEGELSARLAAEYDLTITQRLILQPSVETNLAAQRVEEPAVGQGINDVELGLRLRYEIRRELAPYVGISWLRKMGATANIARSAGLDADLFAVVAGIRAWF